MTDQEQATRALGRTLVEEFGRGWAKAKVDVLLSVFAEDAAFLDSFFLDGPRVTDDFLPERADQHQPPRDSL